MPRVVAAVDGGAGEQGNPGIQSEEDGPPPHTSAAAVEEPASPPAMGFSEWRRDSGVAPNVCLASLVGFALVPLQLNRHHPLDH